MISFERGKSMGNEIYVWNDLVRFNDLAIM